jgi:DNA-binding PadR family transcriptional regulator
MSQKTPTNLGYALLGLVHQAPMSGYDLRKVFAETALGNYSSSPGAIYPALARLEKQGLIRGAEDRSHSLRPRKLYTPTDAGRKLMRGWLAEEVTQDTVEHDIDGVMLRFAFHSILDSRAATRRFLEQFAVALDAALANLDAQSELFPDDAPIHSRLALDAGREQLRATAKWARRAVGHFE